MVNPKTDERLNYSRLLMPEPGMELNKAICTTFSVDIENLLAVIIALGFSIDTPSEDFQSNALIFKALKDIRGKLLVFYDSSQIINHSGRKIKKDIYALLEDILIPVNLPMPSDRTLYPSFHSKTWILQYKGKNNNELFYTYKFLNMSRNLTSDRSWDLCLSLTGKNSSEENKELTAFIDELNVFTDQKDALKNSTSETSSFLKIFKKDLMNVGFNLEDEDIEKFDINPRIIPIGINDNLFLKNENYFNKYGGKSKSYIKLFILSPFIHVGMLKELQKHKDSNSTEKDILITRMHAIESITEENDFDYLKNNFELYSIKDGDDIESEEEHPIHNDIHAKLFLIDDGNEQPLLYIGSMNATDAAENYNNEMLIRLRVKKAYNEFLQDFINPDEKQCLFMKINDIIQFSTNNRDEERKNKTKSDIIKSICRIGLKGKCFPKNSEGKYQIFIESDYDEKQKLQNIEYGKYEFLIAPITNPENIHTLEITENKIIPISILFERIEEISEFYEITIKENGDEIKKSTITIPIRDIPSDRDKIIYKNLLKNDDEVLSLIEMSLTSDISDTCDDLLSRNTTEKRNISSSVFNKLGLYENMLKAIWKNPETLKQIKDISDNMPDESVLKKDLVYLVSIFNDAELSRKFTEIIISGE